ncbi:MAG: hypothetical protein GY778_28245, partial [bacterium]|nr:hypothetical protein [bacterium]
MTRKHIRHAWILAVGVLFLGPLSPGWAEPGGNGKTRPDSAVHPEYPTGAVAGAVIERESDRVRIDWTRGMLIAET